MRWLRLVAFLVLPWLPSTAAGAATATATTANLLIPVESTRPGESFLAGVELTLKPGWHTYWRNGGDSGAAITIAWKLPDGITAGPILWPAPERYAEQDLVTFVHHGTVTFLVPITVAATVTPGPVEVSAELKWLECKESCVQLRSTVRSRFAVGAENRPSPAAPAIRDAQAKLPKPLPAGEAWAAWDAPAGAGDERPVVIRWKTGISTGSPEFFPDATPSFEVRTATHRLPPADGMVVLRKQVRRIEGAWPRELRGVLALMDAKSLPIQAFEVTLPLTEPGAAAAIEGSGTATPGREPKVPQLSLARALLLGLLGGMILNIMPCVLPVIALKILGFVRQSGSRPAEIRKLGLIYGLGVWFSFLVLAGVVIGVKQAAGFASWGMQFGNPVFLVAMTSLVLLVALSLFGVFEIQVGGRALDAAGDLASKEGPAGAFFNGMLAVALATPCTAPFLAPALGYAFAAEALTIVLVFTAIAFGLAAPYVLLSWQPAWLRYLPKPGAWMERFKVAMGFPMLATALWLYTLAADRLGPAGPLWLGLFLMGLALSGWVWGEFVQRGRRRQGLAMAAAIVIVAGFYAFALEKELNWRHPSQAPSGSTMNAPRIPGGIAWQPWSRAAVEAARATGRPVFVDFTADWCLTCKLNERSSIEVAAVRDKLRQVDAVTLKGDHTRVPQDITEELLRFGRAGVPLVLVYPRDPAKEPEVLPEVLTPDTVLEALDRAARPPGS